MTVLDACLVVVAPIGAVVALLVSLHALRGRPGRGFKSVRNAVAVFAILVALPALRLFVMQPYFIPSEAMAPTLIVHDHIFVNKLTYRLTEPCRGDIIVFKAPRQATPNESDWIKRVIGLPGDVVKIKPGYVELGDERYSHIDLRSCMSVQCDGGNFVKVKLADGGVLVNGRPVSNKDIAAAAGDPRASVKVFPGEVYVNGKLLKEPYIAEDCDEPYPGGRGWVDAACVVTDKQGDQAVKIPEGMLLVMGDNRNESNDSRYWGLLDRRRVVGKAVMIFSPADRVRWFK
jgi:signal peptidase I